MQKHLSKINIEQSRGIYFQSRKHLLFTAMTLHPFQLVMDVHGIVLSASCWGWQQFAPQGLSGCTHTHTLRQHDIVNRTGDFPPQQLHQDNTQGGCICNGRRACLNQLFLFPCGNKLYCYKPLYPSEKKMLLCLESCFVVIPPVKWRLWVSSSFFLRPEGFLHRHLASNSEERLLRAALKYQPSEFLMPRSFRRAVTARFPKTWLPRQSMWPLILAGSNEDTLAPSFLIYWAQLGNLKAAWFH